MQKADRTLLLLIIYIFFSVPSVHAAGPVELFRQAGTLYEMNDFTGAVAKYRQVIDMGIENGIVYYNMGNAFFKDGKLGETILAYERALKYLPRDEDVKTNLEFANLLSANKENKEKRANFFALFKNFLKTFTVNEWTYGFEILYAILFFFGIIKVFAKRERIKKVAGIILIAILPIGCFLGIATGLRIYWTHFSKEAVVIEKTIKVHSGPAKSYTLLFSVPEGAKLFIHQERANWLQVTLPNGYNGWINSQSVGII